MSDIYIKINPDLIKEQIDMLLSNDETMTEIQRMFAETIHPYVPYDTGNLSRDITIDPTGVTYHADYAAKNYYGDDIRHHKDKHPLATSHWDEVAMQTQSVVLANKIEELLERKMRELNG